LKHESCSLSKAELQLVVVELSSVLTVGLWHTLSSEATALGKHLWKIILLAVDLRFVQCDCLAVLEVVRVDDCFNFLSLFEYHVVGSGEVTLFKCVWGGTMAEEQVRWLSALVEV